MAGLKLKAVEKRFYPETTFRPGTPCYPQDMNFSLMNGGMGDYICWMTPLQWIAECATWISPNLIVPVYFVELARYFMKKYPHVPIRTYKELTEIPGYETMPCRGPVNIGMESLNATGAHLLTCGWVYYTNREKAPAGWDRYPPFEQADLDAVALTPEAAALEPGKYAVITTGITTPSRHVEPRYWNMIIDYVRELGLTPVFLGKQLVETGNLANVHTKFPREVHYDLGVNLCDRTTLMQAASIMSRAAVVIGHDNGLLHLAACTGVPLVFGYNLASPEHREPRRLRGRTYNVTLTNQELACNWCQSHNNFVIGFSYTKCFYSDLKCIHMLFEDGAKRWKTQIDLALAEGNAHDTRSIPEISP